MYSVDCRNGQLSLTTQEAKTTISCLPYHLRDRRQREEHNDSHRIQERQEGHPRLLARRYRRCRYYHRNELGCGHDHLEQWEGGQHTPRGYGRNSASADKVADCVKAAVLSLDQIHLREAALCCRGISPNATAATNPVRFAVGTLISERPPHRTGRARFGHPAPTLGV